MENRLREDNQIINYLNSCFQMLYHTEQNDKKVFWWWLNKFEYLASSFKIPEENMAKLFTDMVHENIHERFKKHYDALKFDELTYEGIINHYIIYFNYSHEILSHRKPYESRNCMEKEMIRKYAMYLQEIYNSGVYKYRLDKMATKQYLYKLDEMELTKYLKEIPPVGLRYTNAIKFAKFVKLSRYINPAISMIKIYNPANTGEFHEWLAKLEYVADEIKIPEARRHELFFSMVDEDVHSAVKMDNPSIVFSELRYDEMINHYLHYFKPSYQNDLNKTRLYCRKQFREETIEKYANCLKKLFHKCFYINRIEESLCEQFLNGIHDDEISRIIKKFPKLFYNEMVDYAVELTKFKKISHSLQPALSMTHTYDPYKEDIFYIWLNKFEYVTDVIGIPIIDMIEFFQKMVNDEMHKLVQECYPEINFPELSYDDLIIYYLSGLCFSTGIHLHRKRFFCRKQYEQETLKSFADSLWKIQYHCKFTNDLDKKLAEQFHTGIYDERVKTYVDKYPDLSFDIMVAIAIAYSNELMLMDNEWKNII